jgi:predicted RNA-binding Zn ribbon-like protein
METPEYLSELRIVGGDLALDFVNTQSGPVEGPADYEALREYHDFVLWGARIGLMTESDAGHLVALAAAVPDDARAAFARSLETRGRLHNLFGAVASGQTPDTQALNELRDDEVDALRHAQLVPAKDGFAWSWAHDDDLVAPLRSVVHAATELLKSGPLDRVKRCAGCSFIFLDESKNGSRRWCSMEDCGAAEKARRYVARRAAKRRADS